MKSRKNYIHFLWMLLLTTGAVNAQKEYNPYGYVSSVKEALVQPLSVSSVSIYYKQGMIFDVEQGKNAPDAPIENIGTLSNLRQLKLNGCPVNFSQDKFFKNLSKLKQLEVLEIRMSMKKMGVLSESSRDCLEKLKHLKRINLPHQYPSEEIEKLQLLLPNCEIITNLYPEGE